MPWLYQIRRSAAGVGHHLHRQGAVWTADAAGDPFGSIHTDLKIGSEGIAIIRDHF